MTATLYYADIRACIPRLNIPSQKLPLKRAQRMRAYRFFEDRLRCLAGWLLMARILGKNDLLDESRLAVGLYGKPYLQGGPFFSLSHSGNYVLLAVDQAEIGADIEQWQEELCYASLAKVGFHPAEREELGQNYSPQRFYELWAAKESYVKLLGTGFSKEPSSFFVRLRDRQGIVEERPELCLRVYEDLPGYSMAACASSALPDQLCQIRLS